MSNELKVTELDQAMAEIKRQAAEIERLQHWQRAVDDACTASWVTVTDDARETVKALVARECQIAIDPLVSSDAQALIGRGRKDAEAEIERLKTRLEVSPDHDYDGIYCRDATIKLQDEHIAKLREQKPVNARLLAIVHQTVGMIENTSIETGYCCCGDGMDGHASPMICGHSATDQGAYLAGLLYEDAKAAIAAAEAQQAELSSLSDKAASELQADAARYRYIRTHRIGIKWCELYAGGPALDEVIDSMMTDAGPSPINSAGLRAAEQAHAKGRTESVIAIYRAIREAQIDLPPPSSAPSNGAGAGLGERGKSASSVCIQQNDVELHLART